MNTATSTDAPADSELEAFLDLLAAEGFAIGLRERLLASALLARFASDGRLPRDETARLGLLEPLLSRNEDQQGRFQGLIARYLRQTYVRRRDQTVLSAIKVSGAKRDRWLAPWLWWVLASLIVLTAVVIAVKFFPKPEPIPQPPTIVPPKSVKVIVQGRQIDTPLIYVPSAPFPVTPASQTLPNALRVTRYVIGGAGALAALSLLAWFLIRLRRQLYLQGLRTQDEVDERSFHDPNPVTVTPPSTLLRPVSRMLRQRVEGEGTDLDVPATLRATVRNAGVFTPRRHSRRRMPEYVALIERRGNNDQQASYDSTLVAALMALDVPITLYYFDRTPEHVCQRVRVIGGNLVVKGAESFGSIAARFEGHRLIVFADSILALDVKTAMPARWMRQINTFSARAWFTPQPVPSWKAPEALLDDLGFLVLPMQPEALDTLAKWLASDRAELILQRTWPEIYPESLRQDPVGWTLRQVAPPTLAIEALHVELRTFLGAQRFQWLCACAIFPSLSWPLTLALGKEFVSDAADLSLGASTLATLPWFRTGFMPAWIRESLIERLNPAEEKRLRNTIESRLSAAIEGGSGEALVTVAQRRRLWAWLSKPAGLARDVVLVDFLHRGMSKRLAQRLPVPLRRILFRGGNPLKGLRMRWPVAAGVAALAGLVALPGVWERAFGQWLNPAPAHIPKVATLEGLQQPVKQMYWSPDGERLLVLEEGGNTLIFGGNGKLIRRSSVGPITNILGGVHDRWFIVERGGIFSELMNRDGEVPSKVPGKLASVVHSIRVDSPLSERTSRIEKNNREFRASQGASQGDFVLSYKGADLGRLPSTSGPYTIFSAHPNGQSIAIAGNSGLSLWGRKAARSLHIISCVQEGNQQLDAISADAESMAEALFRMRDNFGPGMTAPLVLVKTLWEEDNAASAPARGVILFRQGDDEQRRLAESLQGMLTPTQETTALNPWRVQSTTAPLASVAVSLCGNTGTNIPIGQRAVGEVFKDCDDCPELVVVSAGSFVMGSPVSEQGRTQNEGPQHAVRIPQPLAIGRLEVTRG